MPDQLQPVEVPLEAKVAAGAAIFEVVDGNLAWNVKVLGEREGVRARRPDLTRGELEELLRPEDALPDEHSEWRLRCAKEKLRKALTAWIS